MKILILGSGGREYSIARAILNEKESHELFFMPGNGATNSLGTNLNIKDYYELAQYAKSNNIELTIVGPEAPLVEGVVDIFKSQGLTIFGPSKEAAQLEGSKVYMKNFLAKYNIPTARYIETSSIEDAFKFADKLITPIVVKADGLCGGKGVIIALTHNEAKVAISEMLSGKSFGDAGKKVIVEEFLDGYELSMFAVCDGDNYILLPAAQDHKRLQDNDKGPNTGGMGAYAPTPLVNEELYQKVRDRIIRPTLDGMKAENAPFEGVLFIGIMVVNGEPITLEFNVRFGDPECEILMPLMTSSVSDMFYKAATNRLDEIKVEFSNQYAVGVVMASADYPYKNSTPAEIIIDNVYHEEIEKYTHISYAGVSMIDDTLYADGGRVLVCVGIGNSIREARDRAYLRCGQVHFAGKKLRTDIAYQAL
ncbi:MAG: phosphoribosylamine--glycine ligase [Sulfurimonas sp. RIFOXYD12_FULL_33_39]|uniref:phosphoribosylamine--glycine ligase n=1 Tax=unclassified Sulfurimonas TaxID=2623549 RepID=UPI0008C5FF15|nr:MULTISPECIES: phosphoribosylamine--glycine ligase [unclassified Sulfurimonas]OHE04954.1 MAG: phosphoribosylamine--glycine ligase [Sulfurimonas sp. RIFCSPLOWO2_12_FULL_34_6]OHE10514.1 MAG: phosphoribosylamine--glycine ligase [Sulfurimonas sp. RIFOXYD12_FULL_33_39]OHE14973.1 MAG: phosphoribosylamine--glycine ligase [Sulfurimonas sp. RIFOXYD2_FULL_34_21]DAB28037.1 MAG TPA: phosphoribosylamine--glycine ligase [Sulfurimonas sp. UBA10385]